MTGPRVDHTGEQYGRLTITGVAGKVKKNSKRIFWNAICECGNEIVVDYWMASSGKVKSCGCYRRDV